MRESALERAPGATGNRYDRAEWAGAFGAAMIAVGLYYRTPVPVQPMKAIGAVAATQAAQVVTITPQAVFVGGFALGWLVLVALRRGWVRL